MNYFNVMIVMAISFLFMGCASNVTGQNQKNGTAWEVLIKESNCGIYEPKNILIKSQEEFDALWKKSQKGIDFGPVKPTVDFERKWVIACFLGMVNTGGHRLEIQSIKEAPAMTLITIIHKRPSRDCLTTQVIEFPYFIATVDHIIPEKVDFKIITEEMPCE